MNPRFFLLSLIFLVSSLLQADDRPHIVLVMADDMGWGQTGYYDHPVLKTPNLDAMAENGLRFNRFYAASAVCSPTRASLLTGRHCNRTGVPSHGHALRLQETTIAQALNDAGYETAHFGKWHLNGIRGPGVPILKDDSHSPGAFGFEKWVTVTNFFDVNPIMSHMGEFREHEGDSSEIVVDLALEFIKESLAAADAPTFSVIWYGTPHNPFLALDKDAAHFKNLDEESMHHYGELVAMDRSIGTLRSGLRDLEIAENTLLFFCSDNGGLAGIEPPTVGGLRGNKGTIYEGGLRVPAVLEWPAAVPPRITDYPAVVMDLFPTIAEIVNLPESATPLALDGVSLVPLLEKEIGPRKNPIGFSYKGMSAMIDNDYKLIEEKPGKLVLYNLKADTAETTDISANEPETFKELTEIYRQWSESVSASIRGEDYPEGQVNEGENPPSRFWMDMEEYQPYFGEWKKRWEYEKRLTPKKGKK